MESSCADRDAGHAVLAELRFRGRCGEVGSLVVAYTAEWSSRARCILCRLAFGWSRVAVGVLVVFEDQVFELWFLRLFLARPVFVDLSCEQLVGELSHQLVFLLDFSVNGNDGCASNFVFDFRSDGRATRRKSELHKLFNDRTHRGSSSPSATSTALAKSVFESSESCSSGVKMLMSIWDSTDSLSMTWWLNFVPELLRNIAIGVLRMEVDGLRGSKFMRFLKSPVLEGCATGGDLFTCFSIAKETKKEDEIKLWNCLLPQFQRTRSNTTSLTLLSLSCMLLVVSFVTRFPILLRF